MDIQSQKSQQNPQDESIDFIIKTFPKALDTTDSDVIRVGNYYLPYSTGFEIECDRDKENFNEELFISIPNLMEFKGNSGEERFRIPPGIKGLNCLYDISMTLKHNNLANPLSGIHYHIDFTDIYDLACKIDSTVKFLEIIDKYINIETREYALKELDTWNYIGTYNRREFDIKWGGACWIRFQSEFKTMEIRIGEMTFDYDLLFQRITHANQIATYLKSIIVKDLIYLTSPILLYDNDVETVLNNRTKKI